MIPCSIYVYWTLQWNKANGLDWNKKIVLNILQSTVSVIYIIKKSKYLQHKSIFDHRQEYNESLLFHCYWKKSNRVLNPDLQYACNKSYVEICFNKSFFTENCIMIQIPSTGEVVNFPKKNCYRDVQSVFRYEKEIEDALNYEERDS